jgi:cell division protein FtsZ
MMNFEIPKEYASIIKVIGVGGGGGNAVNHMFRQGIKGVDFMICNTDQQALDKSPVPLKIQLGSSLTQGLGAGAIPEVGRNAAIENINEIKDILGKNTKMVFITAGMGGGTGTGAAPVIAATAREMGILTVAIVTVPFQFEGKKRRNQAFEGLEELRKNVDTVLVISNDKLREMHGNKPLTEAFGHADDVLTTAAKGISEIITHPGQINVDFNDISTIMKDGGAAIMGAGYADGENRAIRAAEQALCSPLLNDNNIKGASQVLLYITSGVNEITMDEFGEISDFIQDEAGDSANIIMGTCNDERLGERICVTIIATSFQNKVDLGVESTRKPEKIVHVLNNEKSEATPPPIPQPVASVPVVETPVQKDEPVKIVHKLEEEVKAPAQEQVSFEFEVPARVESFPTSAEPVATVVSSTTEENDEAPVSLEEQMRRSSERVMRLKQLSLKMKSPNGISELESEPAYKRKNVQFDNIPHSSESQVSKYTLTPGEDQKSTDIRPNNSFLHDAVD